MNEIFQRTSVRRYTSQPVEREKVEALLRAAMAAPSAGNQQPWEFYIVTHPETLRALAACSPYAGCLGEAPLGIAVCYRAGCPMPEYAQIDCSAAVENLLLEAVSQGLGAVWLGVAPRQERMEAVGQVLRLSPEQHAFALIACGYPAQSAAQQDRFDRGRIHWVE